MGLASTNRYLGFGVHYVPKHGLEGLAVAGNELTSVQEELEEAFEDEDSGVEKLEIYDMMLPHETVPNQGGQLVSYALWSDEEQGFLWHE